MTKLPDIPPKDPNLKPYVPDGKCRALGLRGGGTKGAYEAGAIKAMTQIMDAQDVAYDIIEGVSAGAINAGVLATFEMGDEKRAAEWNYQLWKQLPPEEMTTMWPILGPAEALWRPSIFDNSHLVEIAKDITDGRPFQRQVALVSVDANTGEIVIFDETTPPELQHQAIVASASIPSIFPAVKID